MHNNIQAVQLSRYFHAQKDTASYSLRLHYIESTETWFKVLFIPLRTETGDLYLHILHRASV